MRRKVARAVPPDSDVPRGRAWWVWRVLLVVLTAAALVVLGQIGDPFVVDGGPAIPGLAAAALLAAVAGVLSADRSSSIGLGTAVAILAFGSVGPTLAFGDSVGVVGWTYEAIENVDAATAPLGGALGLLALVVLSVGAGLGHADELPQRTKVLAAGVLGAVLIPAVLHWVAGDAIYPDQEPWLAAFGFVDAGWVSILHVLPAMAGIALLWNRPEREAHSWSGLHWVALVLALLAMTGADPTTMLMLMTAAAAGGAVGAAFMSLLWPSRRARVVPVTRLGFVAGVVAVGAAPTAYSLAGGVALGVVGGGLVAGVWGAFSNSRSRYALAGAQVSAGLWALIGYALVVPTEDLAISRLQQLVAQLQGALTVGAAAVGVALVTSVVTWSRRQQHRPATHDTLGTHLQVPGATGRHFARIGEHT